MSEPYINRDLFDFLAALKRNNERVWFQENKDIYETAVRGPLLRFVRDFEEPLMRISRHMVADDRKVGGSLFRIHRDTRFSRDKSPYKTWAALQFRHERARSVHAPGFYLHLEPGRVFAGAGIWQPERASVENIRDAIADDPGGWQRVTEDMAGAGFGFEGESLKRTPRGYDPEHPAAEDLKRKDFVVTCHWSEEEACAPDFLRRYAAVCGSAVPLMTFLTGAIDLPW
jgi:uncharacterized protein (TIGR02453 family)